MKFPLVPMSAPSSSLPVSPGTIICKSWIAMLTNKAPAIERPRAMPPCCASLVSARELTESTNKFVNVNDAPSMVKAMP